MLYDVDLRVSGKVQVVSDQREIRVGDCVAVERTGDTANVRRVSEALCNRANAAAIESVADQSRQEAAECQQAKQQLVDAATPETADPATRKIALPSND